MGPPGGTERRIAGWPLLVFIVPYPGASVNRNIGTVSAMNAASGVAFLVRRNWVATW